ncbi:signal peptidase II [Georhizobium profundi]|jgi:signal peptidase II|uniref:Lipoprotein signal peptidase n=2 Tax=Georhizobium profundi TaxID=2341112 RepID=A0A3S9AYW9_9HYPH|nr:signal peptidase II [Georhizobium profundi]AZN69900.1 signal peptidase II [Georhizobium profundi]
MTQMAKPTPLSRPLPALGLLALLIAADQAIKLWVEAALPLQQPIELLPMLALFRTYNEGIAFSFLAGQSEWTLVAVTTLIVCFVVYLWRSTAPDRFFAHLGYALIVGGAIGNLIDRAAYGHVVDYILVYTETWSFAVFNLADSFITVGAVSIVLDEILAWRQGRTTPKDQAE